MLIKYASTRLSASACANLDETGDKKKRIPENRKHVWAKGVSASASHHLCLPLRCRSRSYEENAHHSSVHRSWDTNTRSDCTTHYLQDLSHRFMSAHRGSTTLHTHLCSAAYARWSCPPPSRRCTDIESSPPLEALGP